MEITKVIYHAVKIMSQTFGGINIEILDKEMVNNGVRILIDSGVKKHRVLLKHEMAEDICFYGESVANTIVYEAIKDDYKQLERKLKLNEIESNNKNS